MNWQNVFEQDLRFVMLTMPEHTVSEVRPIVVNGTFPQVSMHRIAVLANKVLGWEVAVLGLCYQRASLSLCILACHMQTFPTLLSQVVWALFLSCFIIWCLGQWERLCRLCF